MKRSWMLQFALVAGLLATAGAALAGNTWVGQNGARYDLNGQGVAFVDESHRSFNVADLADGESRIFGDSPDPVTATRDGDVVRLHRPPTAEREELELECSLDTDTCRVLTFENDPSRVAIEVRRTLHCEGDDCAHGMALDERIAGRRILVDCDSGEDCPSTFVRRLHGAGGETEIIVTGDETGGHPRVVAPGLHRDALFVTGGADTFDVAELLDGESRSFGAGERQVTATRRGDVVTLQQTAAGQDERRLECRVGRDTCNVLTFDDDPDKVAVMIRQATCADGAKACADKTIELLFAPGEHTEDIHVIGNGDDKHRARVKILRAD